MNFVMLVYVHSGTGYSKMNVGADVPNEPRIGGFNGYSIGELTLDNNGQDLLDALSGKIEHLRSIGLIEKGYEMVSVESSEGFVTKLLPYLADLNPLTILFRPSTFPDDRIYVEVYLDNTSDAQSRKKGGRNKRKNRTLKKLRKYYARRGCKKLKRI